MGCTRPFVACVEEQGTFLYDFTLTKEDGTPVLLSELLTLTLKVIYRHPVTGVVTVIAATRDILNVNGGTYHATNGRGAVRFGAADNVVVDPLRDSETHRAEFTATWAGGGVKRWPIDVVVDNLWTVS